MENTLGIISFEDDINCVEGLGEYRPTPAISFMGRYRIIDFMLSNMTNSGMTHVQVHIKKKPRSLIEHLGTGQHYNINAKRGRLHLLYGETEYSSPVYNTDIASYMTNMQFIEKSRQKYVVIAPSMFIYKIDFNGLLAAHLSQGNDITVVYKNRNNAHEDYIGCEKIEINKDGKIIEMSRNMGNTKTANISCECYIMEKNLFISLIKRGAKTSSLYWFKDILQDICDEYKMGVYRVEGYLACINSLTAYQKSSIDLLHQTHAKKLFNEKWPIHTITNDSSPTLYKNGSDAKNCVIANGCLIKGQLENTVVGRNVVVEEGAVVKNSILLPGSYIGKDVSLNNVVVDKMAIINQVKKLTGTKTTPLYVKRRDRI